LLSRPTPPRSTPITTTVLPFSVRVDPEGRWRCRSEAEQRRRDAELLYDLEVEYRKVGWGDPAYVHDEERCLFHFRDGRFAFSREHADWELLRKRGRLRGPH
jgi:hypothetical protein